MTLAIRIFDSPHDAGIYVAAIAEDVILRNDRPVLGLATGETPIVFYQALIDLHYSGLDLSKVTTINLDEYVGLPSDHAQSYHKFMRENLFASTNIVEDRIFIPNGMAPDLQGECARYDQILHRHPIDLQILGIGINGHIGFNEPGNNLQPHTHVVDLSEDTRKRNSRFFDFPEDVPNQAITIGMQAILQAKRIVLMAFGTEKAEIIRKTATEYVSTNVPASILQLHQSVTLVLDRESARHLSGADVHPGSLSRRRPPHNDMVLHTSGQEERM